MSLLNFSVQITQGWVITVRLDKKYYHVKYKVETICNKLKLHTFIQHKTYLYLPWCMLSNTTVPQFTVLYEVLLAEFKLGVLPWLILSQKGLENPMIRPV